jgi:hypothetical protein
MYVEINIRAAVENPTCLWPVHSDVMHEGEEALQKCNLASALWRRRHASFSLRRQERELHHSAAKSRPKKCRNVRLMQQDMRLSRIENHIPFGIEV